MTKLKFIGLNKDFQKLAAEVLEKKEFRKPYTKGMTTEKGFWLVKDQGIYLINAHKRRANQKNFVIYAHGYRPETNDNWWEDCRDAVGGDDFAEWIPMNTKMLNRISKEKYSMVIDINEESFRVMV